MPYMCCVPGCKGNYKTGPKVHIFKFPEDENLKSNWINSIRRKETFAPTKNTRVCELHFEESDIRRTSEATNSDTGERIVVKLLQPRLMPNAVPKIFPNYPAYLSKEKECLESPLDKKSRIENQHLQKAQSLKKKSEAQLEEKREIDRMMAVTSIIKKEPSMEILKNAKVIKSRKRKLNKLKGNALKIHEKELINLTPLHQLSTPHRASTESQSMLSSLIFSSVPFEPVVFNKNENENLKCKILKLEKENEELRKKNKLLEEEIDNLKKASDVTVAAEKLALQAVQEAFIKLKAAEGKEETRFSTVDETFTVTDNDKVELSRGSGVYIKKQDRQLALSFSQMNMHTVEEKHAVKGKRKRTTAANASSGRQKLPPPLYTITKELYTGPYDPVKLIKFLLRVLFSPEELAKFSANGKRVSSGGNEGIPRKELNAVLTFVIEHCPEVCLSSKHINEAVNSVCCYARKKLNRHTRENDLIIKSEFEIEEMSDDDTKMSFL